MESDRSETTDWQPLDTEDDDLVIILAAIIGVPWLIGVAAIIGGLIWCGLHA